MKSVDVSKVREILSCDFSSGIMTWKYRGQHFFKTERDCNSWNAKYSGRTAFSHIGTHGYRVGGIFGTVYKAHRVVWALYNNEWPDGLIDHINGDRLDNRISNLRVADLSGNARNSNGRSQSKNLKGVTWHKRVGRWQAQIGVNGKRVYLGYYDNEIDAHIAYCNAAFMVSALQ